jgi:ABC-type phosphate transport system substrate-binding protein
MKKTLATLAWAAIPALLLSVSACNGNATGGNSGITPTTNTPVGAQHGRVRPLDNSTADMHGGGATFPAYGYNLGCQPTGSATLGTGDANTGQPEPCAGSLLYLATQMNGDTNNFYYCLTSSGDGKDEFADYGSFAGTGEDACAALGATATGFGGRTNPLDWVGSDIGLASNECCASGSDYYASPYYGTGNSQYGETPLEIPTFGGPIVFPYINCTNCDSGGPGGLTGLGTNQLQLSTWTYCAIANGTIGYWDDKAITADNGGTAVAGHEPITFFYRSGTSGTTYLFENKLENSKSGCNQNWKGVYKAPPYQGNGRSAAWVYGVPLPSNAIWTGPTGAQGSGSTFTGESGNPGVLEAIQGLLDASAFPYGTGYAEGAWAAAATDPSVNQAALLNGTSFISPTSQQAVALALSKVTAGKIEYGLGSDGQTLGTNNSGACELYIPPNAFVSPPTGAYPIVGLSYWLFYNQNQTRAGSNHFKDLSGLITVLDSSTWNTDLPALEYSPLSSTVQKKVQIAAFGKGKSHTGACFTE